MQDHSTWRRRGSGTAQLIKGPVEIPAASNHFLLAEGVSVPSDNGVSARLWGGRPTPHERGRAVAVATMGDPLVTWRAGAGRGFLLCLDSCGKLGPGVDVSCGAAMALMASKHGGRHQPQATLCSGSEDPHHPLVWDWCGTVGNPRAAHVPRLDNAGTTRAEKKQNVG